MSHSFRVCLSEQLHQKTVTHTRYVELDGLVLVLINLGGIAHHIAKQHPGSSLDYLFAPNRSLKIAVWDNNAYGVG